MNFLYFLCSLINYCLQLAFSPPEDLNPRPFSVFRHLRQWRGGGGVGTTPPPGDRPLMVVELRGKKQSTRLDEISRLHILFLVLGQHLT